MVKRSLILIGPGGVGKGPLAELIRDGAVAIDPYRLRPKGPRRESDDPLYAHPKLRTEIQAVLSTFGDLPVDVPCAPEKMQWFERARILFFTVNGNASNAGAITVGALGAGSAPGSLSVAGNLTNSGMITTGVQSGQLGNNSLRVSGALTNQSGGVLALYSMGDTASFGYINNTGSVSIANGAILNVIDGSHASANALPGFLNSGTLTIAQGGTFSSPLNFTQTSGQTTVDGTLRINGNALANFSGGAVYGNGGTILGNVTSNASINIGDMPMTEGLLTFLGNYTRGANGSLTFDIASALQYDQLNVSGRAQLNGLMTVNLLNGYIPQVGNMFDIMNFASESGTFSTVVGLPINNQEHFVLDYNATNLTLNVVSGPGMQAASGHRGSSGSEPFITPLGDNLSFQSDYSAAQSSVPEPGSLLLFGSCIAGMAAFVRRTGL